MTAKKKTSYGALTEVRGLDRSRFVVQVFVTRRDGEAMTPEDYALCEKALPRVETFDDLPDEAPATAAPARKTA